MAELRWLLLILGLVIVAGIYLYARFKPSLDRGVQALKPRREPTIISPSESPDASISPDEPEPEPPAESVPETAPVAVKRQAEDSKIVAIRLMARQGRGFPGDKLILTMRELGLQHGEFGIFHRPAENEDLRTEFSVASLIEPGSFDLKNIKTDSYPGVSIFMMLPGARNGVEIFDDMLETSRSLAKQLDGELLDEQGSSLSVQRQRYLREEIIQFEHQGIS